MLHAAFSRDTRLVDRFRVMAVLSNAWGNALAHGDASRLDEVEIRLRAVPPNLVEIRVSNWSGPDDESFDGVDGVGCMVEMLPERPCLRDGENEGEDVHYDDGDKDGGSASGGDDGDSSGERRVSKRSGRARQTQQAHRKRRACRRMASRLGDATDGGQD